jgi:hypothetical protein
LCFEYIVTTEVESLRDAQKQNSMITPGPNGHISTFFRSCNAQDLHVVCSTPMRRQNVTLCLLLPVHSTTFHGRPSNATIWPLDNTKNSRGSSSGHSSKPSMQQTPRPSRSTNMLWRSFTFLQADFVEGRHVSTTSRGGRRMPLSRLRFLTFTQHLLYGHVEISKGFDGLTAEL